MKINNFDIEKKVMIIAEIGNNHEGNFNIAKDMVKMAADSGADAVKFQTFCVDRYVTIKDRARCEQLKKYELTYEQFELLAHIAKKNDLIFLSTPFDIESADAIESFVPAYKISSGDNTFWPLIEHIARKGKPVLLSTGLTKLHDIEKAVEIINNNSPISELKNALVLLHCISAYPASPNDLNLLAIKYLRDHFNILSGYSDHSMEIISCVAAAAVGARIIEKHFTYKKEGQTFKDHLLSATPQEMKEMVNQIRVMEKMLGNYQKEPVKSEEQLFVAARRSIAAKKNLTSGMIVKPDDITWVRPGNGIKPGEEQRVIGQKLSRNIKQGTIFSLEDFE